MQAVMEGGLFGLALALTCMEGKGVCASTAPGESALPRANRRSPETGQ